MNTYKTHTVKIDEKSAMVDGRLLAVSHRGREMLKEIYHTKIGGYPKFHKMDILGQLGFIATELLLEAEGNPRFVACDDRAVVLCGKHSSIGADKQYQETIADKDNFYPSPSVFIYTLPNIVTGEIALRNKYHGETSYFALDDKEKVEGYMNALLMGSAFTNSMICGWIDALGDQQFEAEMWIAEKK